MATKTPPPDMKDLDEIAHWFSMQGRAWQALSQELATAARDHDLKRDPAWRVVLMWISERDFVAISERLYWDAIEPDFIRDTLARPPEQITPAIARYAAELWNERKGFARMVREEW